MNCDHVRAALADRLDDLLDGEATREVDDHVASCPACAAEADRTRRLREALGRPWAVEAAPSDLPRRIREAAVRHQTPWVGAVVRHGLAFAAGVLVTLALVHPPSNPDSAPGAGQPVAEAAVPPPPPRRIR